jgi:hypothetical protein
MIRIILKYLKPVAIFLSIMVLFQCCRVYYKEPVSVDEAMNNKLKKVKIITIDDRELKFDSIYYKNDKLYGLLRAKKGKSEVLIKEVSIKEIYFFNPIKSSGFTVLIIFGVPIAFLGIAAIYDCADGNCFD